MTRNDSVGRCMCGLIVGVEELVHFRYNNNSMFKCQDKLASYSKKWGEGLRGLAES